MFMEAGLMIMFPLDQILMLGKERQLSPPLRHLQQQQQLQQLHQHQVARHQVVQAQVDLEAEVLVVKQEVEKKKNLANPQAKSLVQKMTMIQIMHIIVSSSII